MNSPWTPATLAILIAASCGGSAAPATSRSPTVPASASPAASVSPAASAATKPTDAVGQVSTKLADGPLAALPTLPLYVNVLDVPQQPGSPLQHAHIAGFVYVVSGTHRLALTGGDTKDSQPGQAVFVPQDVAHTHSNPGTTPSEWYFVALRNTNARAAAPTFPGQTTLYESPDLPANALPAEKKYVEQLNLVTLEKGGRTASHKHGGLEMVVVTDGAIQLKASGQQPLTLTKGKGTVVPPNTVLQATNMGDGQAKFLAFFVTPEGADFSTNVDTLP
jgi:quercetin dioxygenase-like cupin family protein